MSSTDIELLAIDPGKTCGVAAFNIWGHRLDCKDVPIDRLWYVLENRQARIVAVEQWRLYPKMANKLYWHDFPAPEALGICYAWTQHRKKVLRRITPRSRSAFDGAVPPEVPKSYHCHDAVAVGLATLKTFSILEIPDWEGWVIEVEHKRKEKE